MIDRTRWSILAIVFAAAACGGGDAADDTMTAEGAGAASERAPAAELAIPGDVVADDDADGARATGLPREQQLDLQANHPNGTVLVVERVSFAPDHIAVDITVTNGHRRQISLNRFRHRQLRLLDNTGATYNLSPPSQNPEIRVEPGTTMEARLIFLGRISPAASSLTMTTNHQLTGENEHTDNPTIVISGIPVERS